MAPSPTAVKHREWARRERRDEWVESNPLRAWRHTHGYTMSDVATRCGNAHSGVYQHETGGYKPSGPIMKKYAAMMRQSHASLDAAWETWMSKGQSLR